MIPLNRKLRLPRGPFGLLMPLNHQAKKGVTVLAGVRDADYPGELDWYSTVEGRKRASGVQEVHLASLSITITTIQSRQAS